MNKTILNEVLRVGEVFLTLSYKGNHKFKLSRKAKKSGMNATLR